MNELKKTGPMSPESAWIDFMDRVAPVIWSDLSRNARRDINTANRDLNGKRIRKDGKLAVLGHERIFKLLNRFAPGDYEMEVEVVFWRVG